MKSLLAVCAVALLIPILCVYPCFAQALGTLGTPPFTASLSNGTPFEKIDPGNLDVTITVPVIGQKQGRGLPFSYNLLYDSLIWSPQGGTWQPSPSWGWTNDDAPLGGYITFYDATEEPCYGYDGNYDWVQMGYTENGGELYYTDAQGVQHWAEYNVNEGVDWYVNSGNYYISDNCPGNYDDSDTSGAINDDSIFTSASPGGYVGVITGGAISVPVNSQYGSVTITSANGNIINGNGGSAADTIGNSYTINGTAIIYPSPNGGTATYTLKYTAYNVKTAFDCSNIQDYSGTNVSLLTEIDLPDQNTDSLDKYTFQYEATPNNSGYVTGRISKITLPTGGAVTYAYPGDSGYTGSGTTNNGVLCGDGSVYAMQRVTPDSTTAWSYSRTLNTAPASTTTISDPLGDQTVMNFIGLYPVQTQVSDNSSHVLQTTSTCFGSFYGSGCIGSNYIPALPISATTTKTTLLGANGATASEVTSEVDKTYDGQGDILTQKEYDFGAAGSTSPGPVKRQTVTTYYGSTNYPTEIKVEDGSNNVIADTQYQYNQGTPTPTSGVPQFQSGYSGYDVTTITERVSATNSISRTMTYFDTGMVQTSNDFNNNPTTYAYSSDYGYALPTTVTNALNQATTNVYDQNTGLLTSTTDPNNQSTSYSYDLMLRPTEAGYPDGGQTTLAYPSPNEVDVSQKIDSSHNQTGSLIADGLGRAVQAKLTSDPEGTDYVDTTYDHLGRLASVSNPHRSGSSSTDGTTTYAYDALSRPTAVTDQDGSTPTVSYSANCTTATDEAGKIRESCADGLGRFTKVLEDPNNLDYETDYTYDALDDLTGVTQAGSHQRSFSYDGLGRVTSATNPESGTASYGYDSNSNMTSRVDARGITTTISYDALNRLTQKSYSDGTPAANFQYDATSDWGAGLTNTIGRLTQSWTSGTSYSASIYSYDSMGRITTRMDCTPYNCGWGAWNLSAAYDLAGDMTAFTNGQGPAFTQTFDTAGRVISLGSDWSDSTHPATLWAADSTSGYYPAGILEKAALGNGLTEASVYGSRLQPCRLNLNSSGATPSSCSASVTNVVQDYQYTFGTSSTNNGDMTGVVANGAQNFNRTYGYDSLNRLSSMSAPGDTCSGLSFTYDAWGNRNHQDATGGSCNPFDEVADANNHLPSSAGYTYDAAGNMTHDGSHSYTYDAENRLTKVDGGTTATYSYDADGNRTEKTAGSTATEYIYDVAGRVIAEDQGTNWMTGYAYAGGTLVAEYTNNTTYFIHQDMLGSTRLITGYPSAAVVDNMDYQPFGEQIAGGSTTTHKFTGYERDAETGLDNAQARYNSSTIGRFMSPDPGNAGADPTNPQSWNMYSYVNNDPLDAADPTGLGCVYVDDQDDTIVAFDDLGNCGTPAPGDTAFQENGVIIEEGTFTSGITVTIEYCDWEAYYTGNMCFSNYAGGVGQGVKYDYEIIPPLCTSASESGCSNQPSTPPSTPPPTQPGGNGGGPGPAKPPAQPPSFQPPPKPSKSYTGFVACELNQDMQNLDSYMVAVNTAPAIFALAHKPVRTFVALTVMVASDTAYLFDNREACVRLAYGSGYF